MSTNSLEIAWAAGFFEGEGCISRHSKTNNRWALQMASTDKDVIEKFVNIVGIGKLYGPYQQRQRTKDGSLVKPLWRWSCADKASILKFANTIGPFLGERRTSALQKALADLENVKGRSPYRLQAKRRRVKVVHKG